MDRYPMCKSQPARIDCRLEDCRHHIPGECTNPAPAITIRPDDKFVCWSWEERSVPVLRVREAAYQRQPLSGTDAQAPEGALSQTEKELERAKWKAENRKEKLKAYKAEIGKMRRVLICSFCDHEFMPGGPLICSTCSDEYNEYRREGDV